LVVGHCALASLGWVPPPAEMTAPTRLEYGSVDLREKEK
jgi:hypothetical protein